jgi:hypothetical protein
MLTKFFVVLVGDYSEEFVQGLFLDFKYFRGKTFTEWEWLGFGLYFGGVEVWITKRRYLGGIHRGRVC